MNYLHHLKLNYGSFFFSNILLIFLEIQELIKCKINGFWFNLTWKYSLPKQHFLNCLFIKVHSWSKRQTHEHRNDFIISFSGCTRHDWLVCWGVFRLKVIFQSWKINKSIQIIYFYFEIAIFMVEVGSELF